MLSHSDVVSPNLQAELARAGIELSAQDMERLAHHHRAVVLGGMLADAIVWLVRLPRRLATWLTASATHHIAPWRS